MLFIIFWFKFKTHEKCVPTYIFTYPNSMLITIICKKISDVNQSLNNITIWAYRFSNNFL